MKSPGSFLLICIASPSGTGKTTLCRRLIDEFPVLRFSVSTTTRPKRGKEVDHVAYHFVSHERFQELIDADGFAEWADVHGNRYGTTHEEIERARTDSGGGIMFDIDYQGTAQIKRAYPDAIAIFLLPPSMKELERRIRSRGEDGEEQIQLRLRNAAKEIEQHEHFDYVIVNDDLERAYQDLKGIYLAEHCRQGRQAGKAQGLLEEIKEL